MPLEISGYVLEGVRVGQSNGTFTQTPDVVIVDQAAFDTAYPTNESVSRTDYLVLVTSEGTTKPGLLEFAGFGYTKNEDLVDRFAYDAPSGSFKPLRGAAPVEVGSLGPESNGAKRLRVRPPVQAVWLPAAPYRLSVVGSGVDWAIEIVPEDTFGTPVQHTVQLSLSSGNLHWNSDDLSEYAGRRVLFQQQQFYLPKDSTGRLGFAPIVVSDAPLMLNPLPGPGQVPLLRFGYDEYLIATEVSTLSGEPEPGEVYWLSTTGELKFHPDDANAAPPVYYDGVLFGIDLALPHQTVGVISPSDLTLAFLPAREADLIFSLSDATSYYRFPTVVYRDSASFDPVGKMGEVQVDRVTRQVRFSEADRSKHAGKTVTLYHGDLPLERGIAMRLLRNPVNLDGSLEIKDVTMTYAVEGAVWADPMIASPQVSLPSLPIAGSAIVRVIQGQGTHVGDPFPEAASLTTGLGYYIDYDSGTLHFAQRKEGVEATLLGTSDVVLPDSLLLSNSMLLELQVSPGSEYYRELTIGEGALVDTAAGVVSMTSTNALVSTGTASIVDSQLTDTQADFVADDVQPGAVIVLDGAAVYTAVEVVSETTLELAPDVGPLANVNYAVYDGREVLADRYFEETLLVDPTTKVERIREIGTVSLGLSVPVGYVDSSGFRLGSAQEARFAAVVVVDTEQDFTTSLPSGSVEISRESGALNFSPADTGAAVYWVRTLTPKVDYQLQPELGLVQLADRMLAGEEARITYTVRPPSTIPETPPSPPVVEYARFLIRKQPTADHPIPTSTLTFNPDGLAVTLEPAPAVFRGGRPQKLGSQCVVDAALSQITFLPDGQLTDALPHGATIEPNERVYIDYYVTQAVGGEKTFTVLQPPLLTAAVKIGDGDNQFVVHGDQTDRFPGGHLMRIEDEQVYLLGSSSYDVDKNQTTVVLDDCSSNPDWPSQVFQDSFNDPRIFVSSGPTPISTAFAEPSYFVEEQNTYEAVARGSNAFFVAGDQSKWYRPGVVLLFTDGASDIPVTLALTAVQPDTATFTDFLQVTGAAFDADANRTKVMLTANAMRQYVSGTQLLLRSIRPLFASPLTEVQTSLVPKLAEPYLVYRKTVGSDEPGEVLRPPAYKIDDTGHLVFAKPLGPREEFGILYTGLTQPPAGLKLRASYTSQIAPSAMNGLLGQTLLADYSVRSPDSFYFRVETMTNFRGEYAKEVAAAASGNSSGPRTSNASQPKLWEQGRKSLYFDERHLANQDIIARSWLLRHNNLINLLEDYRRQTSGIVVGNNDGKFLFDETIGDIAPPVGNQIDDLVKPSVFRGYRSYYAASPVSRFYPTVRNFYGVAIVTPSTAAGDEVLDTGAANVTGVSNVRARQPWAIVTQASTYSGANTLAVDNANGSLVYRRPAFADGMRVIVQNQSGGVVSVSGTTISSHTATQLILSTALLDTAQIGATVYQDPADPSLVRHVFGRDYGVNGELGVLTYVAEDSGPPENEPLTADEIVSGSLTLTSSSTAPAKFPALFGGIEDDDGDVSFPVQTPARLSEQSYLATEARLIQSTTGLLRTSTTPSFESGTGTTTGGTTFTITGTAPSPSLSSGDLIRITSGANVNLSRYRKVTNVAGSVVTVTGPTLTSGAFTYEATVSSTVVSGTVPADPVSTFSTVHTSTSFSGARVGHTLVFTSGSLANTRVQITSVSGTSVTVSPSLSSIPSAGTSFRVDNPIATYGGTGTGHYLTELRTTLAGLDVVYAEQQATLASAISAITQTGLAEGSLQALTELHAEIQSLRIACTTFRALTSTANYGVYSTGGSSTLSGEFAIGLTSSTMNARASAVSARISELPDLAKQIDSILVTTEQLYDKRYVWIDARINLEDGLVARRELAVKSRIKAQADALKQLQKLLVLGGV